MCVTSGYAPELSVVAAGDKAIRDSVDLGSGAGAPDTTDGCSVFGVLFSPAANNWSGLRGRQVPRCKSDFRQSYDVQVNMVVPVFVLTLDGSEQRRASLEARLKQLSIAYRLWYGIDGRKGLPAEYEVLIDRPGAAEILNKALGNAEIACALSHRAIYAEIVSQSIPWAVVLEDDAVIGPAFRDFVDGTKRFDFDLLLLCHRLGYGLWWRPRVLAGGGKCYRVAISPCSTVGYAISMSGAAELLRASTPLRGVADWPADISRMNTWAALPCIVGHVDEAPGGSTIGHDRTVPAKRGWSRNFTRTYWRRRFFTIFGKKLA